MRLYIAEKPSLARAIAEGLGGQHKKNGCIECANGNVVTWCFGHILEQLDPNEYDEKYAHWHLNDLPIIPERWKLKVKKDARDQYKIIKDLIGKCDEVVNAGDPDREGQLLVDEVLQYVGNKKPVKRILLNALDDKSVKEALQDLRPNENFVGMRNAALGRSRADWLVGMNLSRLYTIKAHDAGYDGVLSVGRVQTPTMALVVRRENEITHFKPTTHYVAQVLFHHANGNIQASWKMPKDMDGLDEEGRLLDASIAEGLIARIQSVPAKIGKIEQQKKQEGQHLPYSLSALQIEAGRRHGYTPQQVLDTMQKLYEQKFTTYPRSDCDYLPTNQLSDAPAILKNLAGIQKDGFSALVAKADTSIRSRAWNDKKISAHHAIIPTTVNPKFESLSEIEQNLYYMVAQAYLAQFFPIHTYQATRITIEADGEHFIANGKAILENGWKDIYAKNKSEDDEKEGSAILPDCQEGDSVTFAGSKILEKETKPPKRFNPSTLLKAMKEIYKYVKDPSLKAELKECSGIGTEATRAGIIDGLQKRGFLAIDKKNLVPTDKACMAIKFLPETITYPDTTAVWEEELEEVLNGTLSLDDFQQKQEGKIREFLKAAESIHIAPAKNAVLCPNCHKPMKRRKGKNGFFWGCTGYPECKTTFPDKNGKPDFKAHKSARTGKTATCPKCGKNLIQIKGSKGLFWACEDRNNCGATFNDEHGKPSIHRCPTCKKGFLNRYESRKKKGAFFWACSDRNCKTFLQDDNGKPGEPFPPRS